MNSSRCADTDYRAPDSVTADVLSDAPLARASLFASARSARAGSAFLCRTRPFFMPEADGIVKRAARNKGRADLMVFAKEEASQKRLLLAGCDPATSLVSNMVERISGIEIVSAAASSKLALAWLKEGKVHIAGSHLRGSRVRRVQYPVRAPGVFRERNCWSLRSHTGKKGFVVASGNPKGIRRAEDLGRRGVRFINREPGSGSRALLDRLIEEGRVAACPRTRL